MTKILIHLSLSFYTYADVKHLGCQRHWTSRRPQAREIACSRLPSGAFGENLRNHVRMQIIKERLFQGGRMGLIVGIPASVAMTELMIRGNEPERIYDRCFRLRHNQNQVEYFKFVCQNGTVLQKMTYFAPSEPSGPEFSVRRCDGRGSRGARGRGTGHRVLPRRGRRVRRHWRVQFDQ